MNSARKQSYYEVLDINLNATQELIRLSYIRAKNTYNRDSLAAYSLFDADDAQKILAEIEEAYLVLSDEEKRRKYDESHGFVSSDQIHAQPMAEVKPIKPSMEILHSSQMPEAYDPSEPVSGPSHIEEIPFRSQPQAAPVVASATSMQSPKATAELSPVERLKAAAQQMSSAPPLRQAQFVAKTHMLDPEMEEKIQRLENVNGAFLKSIREYKQMSVDEVMDLLKISRNYLLAIEADDFAKLPATVFVRGFVIQYAKALKIDHEKVTSAYMTFLKSRRPA